MADTQFSRGPWKLDLWPHPTIDGVIGSACIVEPSGGVIAALSGWDEMHEPDAILMAASPDLYAACADAEAVYEECRATSKRELTGEQRQRLVAAMMAAVKACAAAAQKARGESP